MSTPYDGRRGWIHHLAVAPPARGQGLGGQLLVEVERRLRAHGCRKVNLHITPENASVGTFYARHGYHEKPLIFMEKWLV